MLTDTEHSTLRLLYEFMDRIKKLLQIMPRYIFCSFLIFLVNLSTLYSKTITITNINDNILSNRIEEIKAKVITL